MADQRQSHNKHHHEVDNKSEQKPQKLNKNELAEPTSITTIYYDCLERIFDFLDLESLLNVAGTCKRLQIAAAAKFRDEFSKRKVILHRSNSSISTTGHNVPGIYTYRRCIEVFELKFCLPFLRCFGAKLSVLNVYYENSADETVNHHLDRYINRYCADTLNEFTTWNRHSFAIENFPKPFKNVAKVDIYNMNLRNQLPHLVNLFPNLRDLILCRVIIDETAAAVSFPHMERLYFEIWEGDAQRDFTGESAVNFLHANRQLKSLYVCFNIANSFNNFLNMISRNPFISTLIIASKNKGNVSAIELNRLASEYPLLENLNLYAYEIEVDDAIMFIRQLNSLKKFTFRAKSRAECDRLLNQLDSKWKNHFQSYNDSFLNLINLLKN